MSTVQQLFVIFLIVFVFSVLFFYNNGSENYTCDVVVISTEEPEVDTIKINNIKHKSIRKTENSKWSWICSDRTCKKQSLNDTPIRQSRHVCETLCGIPQLWPKPTGKTELSQTFVKIQANNIKLFTKQLSDGLKIYVNEAFVVMRNYITKLERTEYKNYNDTHYDSANEVKVIIGYIKDKNHLLTLETKENYRIEIKTSDNVEVVISAETFYGIRHAFETLSQLIWFEPFAGSLIMHKEAVITDAPKFAYRGLMIDTSRNFYPVQNLYRVLDAMGASKLNTLHWHISDSQSFSLQLISVPELALYGAYSPDEVYTTADVKALVRYARIRGIRIVIETDAPSHVGKAWSWGPESGLGELALCVEASPWKSYCGEPPCGQLNPLNPNVYIILEKVYREIINLTEVTDIFHLGGDEVNFPCWFQHYPKLNSYELWTNFTEKALVSLKTANNGVTPQLIMLWSSRLTLHSNFQKIASKHMAIQIWEPSTSGDFKRILDKGFRSIISNVNPWYLNVGLGSWTDSSDFYSNVMTWQMIYEHRPWSMNPTWKIEGGEVCMWSEQTDAGSLDIRLWPRAGAAAERLWSDPSHKAIDEVYTRYDTYRQRLLNLGVNAAPIWPKWCSDNPSMCVDSN